MRLAIRRRNLQAALVLAVSSTFVVAGAPALGNTVNSTLTSPNVAVSPNPTAGSPVTLTESGTANPGATLTVSAQLGPGASCGQVVIDRATVSGTYTHTSMFTPAQPGTYLVCLLLTGSSGGSTQTQLSTVSLTVAPAPPKAPAGPATPAGQQPLTANCVAPRLRRHSLSYARHLLALANCTLGRALYPRIHRRSHHRAPRLWVTSQTPRAGSTLSPRGSVSVRLGLAGRRYPQPHTRHRR